MNAALLRRVVGLLPERLAGWGQAMQAELATVPGGAQRARFVLGCSRVVLTRPVGAARAGWWLARLAALLLAVLIAASLRVPQIRLEALAAVAATALAVGLLPLWCGPVSRQPGVALVAAGGSGLAITWLLVVLETLRVPPPPSFYPAGPLDPSDTGVDLAGLVLGLAIFLVALLRATASRAALTTRTVIAGGASAAAAGGLWLGLVLIRPATAHLNGPSLYALLAAGLAAAGLTNGRRLAAALLAASGAAGLISLAMVALPLTSGHFVPHDAPPSPQLPAPTRVVDSSLMALIWLLGSLVLVTLARSPRPAPVDPELEDDFVLELG